MVVGSDHAFQVPLKPGFCHRSSGPSVGGAYWEGSLSSPEIVDGIRIDWSAPPSGAVMVKTSLDGHRWHEASGWIPTPDPAQVSQVQGASQAIFFPHAEKTRLLEIQMRDERNQGGFGISQVSLIGNSFLN